MYIYTYIWYIFFFIQICFLMQGGQMAGFTPSLCRRQWYSYKIPTTVAEWSTARNVFYLPNTRIVGSKPIWGTDICPRRFCLSSVGRCLANALSPVQGVLPNAYK
jgi:hypothetical protein